MSCQCDQLPTDTTPCCAQPNSNQLDALQWVYGKNTAGCWAYAPMPGAAVPFDLCTGLRGLTTSSPVPSSATVVYTDGLNCGRGALPVPTLNWNPTTHILTFNPNNGSPASVYDLSSLAADVNLQVVNLTGTVLTLQETAGGDTFTVDLATIIPTVTDCSIGNAITTDYGSAIPSLTWVVRDPADGCAKHITPLSLVQGSINPGGSVAAFPSDYIWDFTAGNGINTTVTAIAPSGASPSGGVRVVADLDLAPAQAGVPNAATIIGGRLYVPTPAAAAALTDCSIAAAITTMQPTAITDAWRIATIDSATGCMRWGQSTITVRDANGGAEVLRVGRASIVQFDPTATTPGSGIIPIATAITQPALGDIRVTQAFDNCQFGTALPKVTTRAISPVGNLKGFAYTDGTDCLNIWEPPVTCNDNYEMMTHGIGWNATEGWQFGRFTDRYATRASSTDIETWDFNRDRVLILNGTNPKTVNFPSRATSCDPLNFVIITNENVPLTVNVPAGDNLIPISGTVASTQTFTPAPGKRGRVEIIYSGGGTDWHVWRSNND